MRRVEPSTFTLICFEKIGTGFFYANTSLNHPCVACSGCPPDVAIQLGLGVLSVWWTRPSFNYPVDLGIDGADLATAELHHELGHDRARPLP